MNRQLQLYISGERIDLFSDESITITQSIQNVKDIEKIFTSFTKTFSVPASKTNNKIFKHYYNWHIRNGFDARLKVNASLEINNLPFKRGKVKLEGVDLKNKKAHTYRITFFGNTVELKDLLGDDKLNDLSFTSHNLLYGANTVKGRLTQPESSTRHVIAPLITHTQRLYYDSSDITQHTGNLYNQGVNSGVNWNQLKYAIRVNKIIEEIESRYVQPIYPVNLTFSSDFFKDTSNDVMNKLFMWLHRKSGDVENLAGTEEVVTLVDEFDTFQDSDYDVVHTGVSLYVGEQQIVDQWELDVNPSGAHSSTEYVIQIYQYGNLFYQSATVTGSQTIDMTTLVSDLDDLYNYEYEVYIVVDGSITFSNIIWKLKFDQQGEPILFETIDTGIFSTATVFQFNINQQIPDIKVIEFLTGLFKMFNLTAFIDEANSDDNNSIIKVMPLDDYYSEGKSNADAWDITEFVDIDKGQVNSALPYRRIVFQYKDTKTFLANRFSQLANRDWGEVDYSTGEAELAGGLYKIEAPFSHFQFERLNDADTGDRKDIMWGWSVNESQNSYKGDPLLFYPIRTQTGNINFVDGLDTDGNANSKVTINYVNLPSNSLELTNASNGVPSDTTNINFANEFNEWTGTSAYTGTLFENYYKDYITDIYKVSNRLVKVTAYLPLSILINLELNDEVRIGQDNYRINSMTTNLLTGKTDFELLNRSV